MKDKDMHNHIESQNQEENEALFSRLSSSLEFTTNERPKNSVKRRIVTYATSAAAIVCLCLVIIIPILISNDNKVPDIRYYSATDCVYQPLEYSIKDYSKINNLEMLYVDWYDLVEEYKTQVYIDKDDQSDIIYFEEILVNLEKEIVVTLYITDVYTQMDFLDGYCEGCDATATLDGLTIRYKNTFPSKSFAYFQYNNNSYYILLQSLSENLNDEQLIINIVEGMLQ